MEFIIRRWRKVPIRTTSSVPTVSRMFLPELLLLIHQPAPRLTVFYALMARRKLITDMLTRSISLVETPDLIITPPPPSEHIFHLQHNPFHPGEQRTIFCAHLAPWRIQYRRQHTEPGPVRLPRTCWPKLVVKWRMLRWYGFTLHQERVDRSLTWSRHPMEPSTCWKLDHLKTDEIALCNVPRGQRETYCRESEKPTHYTVPSDFTDWTPPDIMLSVVCMSMVARR